MNEFEIEGADEVTRKSDFVAGRALRDALKLSPEEYAGNASLAAKTGLPVDLVGRHKDELTADAVHDDGMRAMKDAPVLKRNVIEEPGFAERMGATNVVQVGRVERAVRAAGTTIKATRNNYQRTVANQRINEYYYAELTGAKLTQEQLAERTRLEEIERERPNYNDEGDVGLLGKVPYHSAGFVPDLVQGYWHSLNSPYPSLGFATGAAGGGLVTGGAGAIPGAVIGTVSGMQAGMMEYTYRQEAASAYRSYRQIKDENGKPIDPEIAKYGAQLAGALSAGLELFGVEGQLAGQARGLITRRALAEALGRKTVREALAKWAGRTGTVAATEAVTEALQSIVQDVGVYAAVAKAGTGEAAVADDWWDNFKYGAEAGFFGGSGIGSVTNMPALVTDVSAARSTDDSIDGLRGALDQAREVELLEREPTEGRRLIDEILQDEGAPEQIYMDSDKLTTLFQQMEDPAAEAPRTYAAMQNAQEGDRIPLDVAEMYSTLARLDDFEQFSGDLAVTPDGPTLNQHREVDMDAVMAERDVIQAELDQGGTENRIANFMVDRLSTQYTVREAQHMAAVFAAQVDNLAAKAGMDPWEMFKSFNLDVATEARAMDETDSGRTGRIDSLFNMIREGNVPTEADYRGASLSEFLDRKGGIHDEGGEISGYDWNAPRMPGMPRVGRSNRTSRSMSLETAYERARDAGYIEAERNSTDLLTLIDQDQGGQAVYAAESVTSPEKRRVEQLSVELEHLERYLNEHELDVHELDNAALKQAMGITQLDQTWTWDSLTQREQEIVMRQMEELEGSDIPRFELYIDTGWGQQVIASALTREAISFLVNGKEPDFASPLDATGTPSVRNIREALKNQGFEAAWNHIGINKYIGHAGKPGNSVNGTFMNCSPTKGCATYCYATRGNYAYSQNIVLFEMKAMALEQDPQRVADIIAREYTATLDWQAGKALRFFDKGDISEAWLPVFEELEKQKVRAHIFSKRPEVLRQVSDYHLRLLSVDKEGHKLATDNQDLPWAYVYDGSDEAAAFINEHKHLDPFVLPIKVGEEFLTKEQINKLDIDKGLICPETRGSVALKPQIQMLDEKGNITRTWPLKDTDKADKAMAKYTTPRIFVRSADGTLIKDFPDTAHSAKRADKLVAETEGAYRETVAAKARFKFLRSEKLEVRMPDGTQGGVFKADAKGYAKAKAHAKKVGGRVATLRNEAGDWTCRDCDRDGGIGCYRAGGQTSTKKPGTQPELDENHLTKSALEETLGTLRQLLKSADESTRRLIGSQLAALSVEVQENSYTAASGAKLPEAPDRNPRGGIRGEQAKATAEKVAQGAVQEFIPLRQLDQSDPLGPRGHLTFDDSREFFTLTLTGTANRSTFLHESMHFMLEAYGMYSDVPAVQADLDAILGWMGVDSFDKIETVHHERLATAFEAYLFRGDVPNPDLAGTFKRIKMWMRQIYKQITNILDQYGAVLSDDISGVFDRMVASEKQIAEAKADTALVGVFRNADQGQMDAEQWKAHQANYDEALAGARDSLEAELMAEAAKQFTADAKARKRAIKQEVIDGALREAPGSALRYILRRGEMPGGKLGLYHDPARLDLDTVRGCYRIRISGAS